jgi:hypothetical protein
MGALISSPRPLLLALSACSVSRLLDPLSYWTVAACKLFCYTGSAPLRQVTDQPALFSRYFAPMQTNWIPTSSSVLPG